MNTRAPGRRPPAVTGRTNDGAPIHHKGRGPVVAGWLDPRGRALGGRTFAVHRVTGLLLVIYLYVHLGVLSMLLAGPSSWNGFVSTVTAPLFLGFDVVLVFMLLFHALNGVRVALVGSGYLVGRQRLLFGVATTIGTIALAAAAIHILGGV